MDGTCSAYPEGIPFKFLAGSKHLDRQPDQSGDFVFEWASPVEQRDKYLLAKHKKESLAEPLKMRIASASPELAAHQ